MLAAEELIALVDALRQANFKVSTQQLLAAQALLLKLATRGSLPDDPQKLNNWLGPIFCTNPQEQEAFPELFRQWLAQREKQPSTSSRWSPEFKSEPPLKPPKLWLRIFWAMLLVLAISVLIHSAAPPIQQNNPVTNPVTTETKTTAAETDQPIVTNKPQPTFINITAKKRQKLLDKPDQLALALSPLTLYLLGLLVYGGYRYFLRRAVLRKLATAEQPDLRQIQIPGVADWAFGKQAFRRLLQILHQHRTVATDRLDAAASVQATINNGGLFSPVYGARKAMPEYLALVDRLGAADAQATLADSLLDRLASGKLFVDRYQFHADPRLCRKAVGGVGQPVPSLTLKELSARYGGHALLVFSDGGGFINPYSGALKPGVEQLRSWPERVLFSPEAGTESFAQIALEPLDFKLTLPLSQAGLSALATRLQQGDTPLQARNRQQPDDYPRLLQQSTSRWLERLAPRPEITEKLCLQLKDYLGEEGYQWLCACAIYPLLVWDMTLFLGGNLGIAAQPLNTLLPRLVRLPWFRHGSMPDWLRARLLQALPDKTQQRLRAALLKLLTIEPKPNQAVTLLDIAVDKPPRFWQRWQSRLKLQAKAEAAPDNSPLRDYVFLSFMAGRRIDPLHLQAPQRLQRLERLRRYKVVGALGLLALAASASLVYFWLQPVQSEQWQVEIPAMVDIPSGSFQMGCVENNQYCQDNEKPVHSANIRPFQLGVYEVTVRQFKFFVDATGYQTTAEKTGACYSFDAKYRWDDVKGNSWRKTGYTQTDDSPVVCTSWDDVQAYLTWLSQQTQQEWRLPTEAEWEYAARAGTKTTYSWGDELPVCDNHAVNGAQFLDCKEKAPVKVGSFSANPFGLYDMHGNVWEWTEDCWQGNYDNALLDGKARTNCDKGSSRVLRGGSWTYEPFRLRSAYRDLIWQDDRFFNVGFRAARTLNPVSFNNESQNTQPLVPKKTVINKEKKNPADISTDTRNQRPVIEIIDPPIIQVHGIPTAKLNSIVEERDIIGKFNPSTKILSITVNDLKATFNEYGIFKKTIKLRGKITPVNVVVVEENGSRWSLDFILSLEGQIKKDEPLGRDINIPDGKIIYNIDFGNYYALIIGNNHYKKLPSLNTPANDARAVDKVLKNKYGFKTQLLLDADRYQILLAMNNLRGKLTENDNLLIYYSGHGELDEVNTRGYWLPVDADADNNANWISTVSITDILNSMSPKHIMIVADSSYSGAMIRSSLARLDSGMSVDHKLEWLKAMLKAKSRTVLTSGGLKPVADGGGDHSVFANALIKVLENNAGLLEGQELYRKVSADMVAITVNHEVAQAPQYAPISHAGHEAGEFFFVPK